MSQYFCDELGEMVLNGELSLYQAVIWMVKDNHIPSPSNETLEFVWDKVNKYINGEINENSIVVHMIERNRDENGNIYLTGKEWDVTCAELFDEWHLWEIIDGYMEHKELIEK